MLFKTLSRMIERKNTEGLIEKIDVLYIGNRLTKEEYLQLTEKLNDN